METLQTQGGLRYVSLPLSIFHLKRAASLMRIRAIIRLIEQRVAPQGRFMFVDYTGKDMDI
ncbi:hypothetical protein [Paenibacillus sp. P32E]|uniref:hypothetical protein n=1 Tax=Paenibacillus sp. P32E TaxID=1349434 RepID=UPI0015B7A4D7|nr:hypothetical protein [Paenibacillus sp. P32E]